MISDTIKYIGVDDLDIDLFESQYVVPEGMSYNSYLIEDEKIAVMVLQTVVKAKSGRPTSRLHSMAASQTIWWLTTWNQTTQHLSPRCWRPILDCSLYAVPQQ